MDILDNRGMTALHLAAYDGCVDVVRLLVDSKADQGYIDMHDRIALDYARCPGVQSLLAEFGPS